MNNTLQSIRVALFFCFGIALIIVVHQTLRHTAFYENQGYAISAAFTDLRQLKEGDDVRMAGVRIGNVQKTTLKDGKAIAVLNIEPGYTLPADSTASIATAGLLGANYVAIIPGKSANLAKKGDVFQSTTNGDGGEFGDIGNKVDTLVSTVQNALKSEPGQGIGDFFGKLNKFFDENKTELKEFIHNIHQISNDVAKGKGMLNTLIHDEKVAGDFKNIMTQFKEFSEKLNGNNSTLGKLITSDDLYKKAEDTFNRIDAAVDSFEDNGPLTAVGVAASALF